MRKEIFKIWAPPGEKWVDWVRPVLFVAMKNKLKKYKPAHVQLQWPLIDDLDKKSTAIIVDFPGQESVEIGILLAKQGFRPIPVFNGTIQQEQSNSLVHNDDIMTALAWGAIQLKDIDIEKDASPAFLTDCCRMNSIRTDVSVFDNSWDLYHQDLPSESYFIKNGIKQILVIGPRLSKDLKNIFAEYDKKVIKILWTNGYDEPKTISYKLIKKSSILDKLMRRDG